MRRRRAGGRNKAHCPQTRKSREHDIKIKPTACCPRSQRTTGREGSSTRIGFSMPHGESANDPECNSRKLREDTSPGTRAAISRTEYRSCRRTPEPPQIADHGMPLVPDEETPGLRHIGHAQCAPRARKAFWPQAATGITVCVCSQAMKASRLDRFGERGSWPT